MTCAGSWLRLVAGILLAGQGPAYVTEEGPPRRFEIDLTLSLQTPQLTAREWVLFAPRPPDLAGQNVQAASLQPGGRADAELSAARRTVLKVRVPATDAALQQGVAARARYEVTLRERRLVEAGRAREAVAVKPLTAEARKHALAESKTINFRSTGFQKWLDEHQLHRRKGEHEVEFGRRAFLTVVKNFRFGYHARLEGQADAICDEGRSDCGGLSKVFVAALRANHIPARLRVGRWAQSQQNGERLGDVAYRQEHVIAEFFAPGAGWVAADCGSAVKLGRTPDRLHFFGHFRADLITLHVDSDLTLDTVHFGRETVPWVQGIVYWAYGRGDLKGLSERQEWRVRALP
jgi:transglutaminase-like putative cysteine protease